MIRLFDGSYAFLSNFFDYCPVRYDGQVYRNSEAAYQANKSTDKNVQKKFHAIGPGAAKRLGQNIQLRSDWDDVRADIMRGVVHAKFTQHPDLAAMLLRTGDEELMEGNYWHDNYFGDCQCQQCRNIPGQNMLGKILMEERKQLKNSG